MTRRAHTLVEMLVVLAVLGTIGLVAAPALRQDPARAAAAFPDSVRLSSQLAIREGRSVTVRVRYEGRVFSATAFPDGRVITDTGTGHRLTFLPEAARGR